MGGWRLIDRGLKEGGKWGLMDEGLRSGRGRRGGEMGVKR